MCFNASPTDLQPQPTSSPSCVRPSAYRLGSADSGHPTADVSRAAREAPYSLVGMQNFLPRVILLHTRPLLFDVGQSCLLRGQR